MRHWLITSKTDDNSVHVVFERKGTLYCSCVAGDYKKDCWHVKKVQEMIELGVRYLGDF